MTETETMETQITDVEDLEDRIIVLESVVEELNSPVISKAQLEISLNQYVILEDSVLNGLQNLAKSAESPLSQQKLTGCIAKFNTLGADFQDTWSESYWEVYELIREGYKKSDKKKTGIEIAHQVADVQDIALTLNSDRKEEMSSTSTSVLKEVDELSERYKTSTLSFPKKEEERQGESKCCTCELF